MPRYYKSRTYWLVFLSSLVASMAVAVGVFLYSWQVDIADGLEASQRESLDAVGGISDYVDDILKDLIVLTGELRSTEWVQKLCVEMDIFDESFDYVRRREITSDFLFHVGKNNVIAQRFLIFPYRDICIGQRVWADTNSYFGLLGLSNEARSRLLQAVINVSSPTMVTDIDIGDRLLICFPIEMIGRSRAFLCCFLGADALKVNISQMLPNGITGMRIVGANTGNLLVSQGACELIDGMTIEAKDSIYMDWRYEYYVDGRVATVDYFKGPRPATYAMIASGICLLAAYALSLTLYRPIAKLMTNAGIRRATERRGASDYKVIGEHIDYMTQRYNQSRRTALLHQLLSGYFKQDEALLEELGMVFRDEGCYRVFLCVERTGMSGDMPEGSKTYAELMRFFQERQIHVETFHTIDSMLILITSFDDETAARQLSMRAFNRIATEQYIVFAGGLAHGLIGISISYQSAREKHRHLSGISFSKYYFPLDWENQLMDALFSREYRVVEGICAEVRRENESRIALGQMTSADYYSLFGTLIDDVTRVVFETNRKSEGMLKQLNELYANENPEDIWKCLLEFCETLCNTDQNCERENPDLAQQIIRFIDANFNDYNLSLNTIEEVFGVSANTINKCIKRLKGVTFHTYLTKKRVGRAKELLPSGEWRISQIATMVGYDTEYSFRRAFHRHVGIKAQDYTESHTLHE